MDDRYQLSETASEFIRQCKRRATVSDRKALVSMLEEKGIPAFESLLEFQENYGGLSYQFGGKTNYSCTLDVMDETLPGRRLPEVMKYEEQEVVECLRIYADGWRKSGFMDRRGQLYILIGSTFNLIAEHIHDFLESEAVKYSLLQQQQQWILKTLYESEVSAWLTNKENLPILMKQASRGSSQWWKNADGRVYVHIQNGRGVYAEAYAAESSDLEQLGLRGNLSLKGFPVSCYYAPEKEEVEIDNTKEMYRFNDRLYRTCDDSKITVPQVKEAKDIYLYVSVQKDDYYHKHPVEHFLNRFPEFVPPSEDYDAALMEYALQHDSENILKLISYLARGEHSVNRRSTVAESKIYMMLFKEYLRRIVEFIEKYPVNVHPLYFHPFRAADVPVDFDLEEDYYVVKKIKDRYESWVSNSKRTLFYMQCALQGNEVAALVYRIYEPLLLLFSLGGTIRTEHGFIDIGAFAIHRYNWQDAAGKEPIDIYHTIAELWKHRNREYAVDRINHIKWNEKRSNLSVWYGAKRTANDERLKLEFERLERKLGLHQSDNRNHFELGELASSELLEVCPKLQSLEGTVAHWITSRYLRWAKLLDKKHPIAIKHPCLYEPFIEMLAQENQIELWEDKTLALIQRMDEEPMINVADALRTEK